MNWKYETFRRLYVREEGTFAALKFAAKALAGQLLKLCDAKGRIYPRDSEDIRDSICFRLLMDRGERRFFRPCVDMLLAEGHLVVGDRGSVRIKNFRQAHGIDVEEAGAAQAPMALVEPPLARPGQEPGTTEQRTGDEPGTSEQRTGDETATNEELASNANCVKSAETGPEIRGTSPLPSVPFPSVRPTVPSIPTPEGVRASAYTSQLKRGFDTQRLLDTFGRVRNQVSPNCVDWHAAGKGLWETAALTVRYLDAHPDAVGDVEQTMRIVLADARDSQDNKDLAANVLFGRWASTFTELLEQVRGLRRPASSADKPCDFHARGRNTGKAALKHEYRPSCAECRHLDARAGPRPAARPQTGDEILGGASQGR